MGAGWVSVGVWLGMDTRPFPTATGGGMSSSSMALPSRTEASRFSSVWEEIYKHGFQRRPELRTGGGPGTPPIPWLTLSPLS